MPTSTKTERQIPPPPSLRARLGARLRYLPAKLKWGLWSAAAAVGLLVGVFLTLDWIVFSDVRSSVRLSSLDLRQLPDLSRPEGSEIVFATALSDRLVRMKIGDSPWLQTKEAPVVGLVLSIPQPPAAACTTIRLTASRVQGGTDRRLGVVPVGRSGCMVSVVYEVSSAKSLTPPASLPANHGLVLEWPAPEPEPEPVLKKIRATETVFENVRSMEIGGVFLDPVDFIDAAPGCKGKVLDFAAGSNLVVHHISTDFSRSQPSLLVDLSMDKLSALRLDGSDCRVVLVRQALRSHIWASLGALGVALISFAVAFLRRTRAAGPAVAMLVLLSGAGRASASGTGDTDLPSRQVLIVPAWISCGSRVPDEELRLRVRAEAGSLADTVRKVARDLDVRVVDANPTSAQLLSYVSADARPLWFIYQGHARIDQGKSVICLPDDDLRLERLVAARPAGVAASFWFNACSTATLGLARSGTSVISGSSLPMSTSLLSTYMGPALLRTLEDRPGAPLATDANCDGLVTDRELFEAVAVELPRHGRRPPRPKFRQQSWAALPLFEVRRLRPACANGPPSMPSLPGDLANVERAHRLGRVVDVDLPPPVLWLIDPAQKAVSVSPDQPRLDIGHGADFARQSSALLFVVPLWVDVRGGRVKIRDARDSLAAPLWDAPVAATPGSLNHEFAGRLLRASSRPDRGRAGEERQRFSRPVTAAERQSLASSGFEPCACGEQTGACFCRPQPPGASPP